MRASSTDYRMQLRDDILAAALNLFRDKGFKAVRMDDVAHAVGISKRTLYEVYPNKEDLVLEAVRRNVSHTYDAIQRLADEGADVMEVLTESFRMHFNDINGINPIVLDDLQYYPRVCQFLEQHKASTDEGRKLFFERGQKEGYILPDANLDLLNELDRAWSSLFSKERVYLRFAPRDLLRTSMLVFVRSVCTEKGVAHIDEMLKTL